MLKLVLVAVVLVGIAALVTKFAKPEVDEFEADAKAKVDALKAKVDALRKEAEGKK